MSIHVTLIPGDGIGPEVVNLAVDPSLIQVRVSGVCLSGYAMRAIAGTSAAATNAAPRTIRMIPGSDTRNMNKPMPQ